MRAHYTPKAGMNDGGNGELKLQISRLQARIDNLTAEHAAEKQRLMAECGSFSHSAAHDLQNQVAAIHGFAHLLLDIHAEYLPLDARDNVRSILHGADQLSAMLKALREIALIASRPLHTESVEMTELARDTAYELSRRYAGRKLDVSIGEMPAAAGDPLLLRLALHALMDNAWKFTAHTADAVVRIGAATSADGAVTYHVRDNGVGFSPRESAKAFLPFRRGPSAKGFSGVGIGLATVKCVIDKHSGRVWAECNPDTGTVFHFTLGKPAA